MANTPSSVPPPLPSPEEIAEARATLARADHAKDVLARARQASGQARYDENMRKAAHNRVVKAARQEAWAPVAEANERAARTRAAYEAAKTEPWAPCTGQAERRQAAWDAWQAARHDAALALAAYTASRPRAK